MCVRTDSKRNTASLNKREETVWKLLMFTICRSLVYKTKSEFLICVVSFPERVITRRPHRSAPIPRLQSITPQTRPSVAHPAQPGTPRSADHLAHKLISLNIQQLQAQVYMTNNRTKQQTHPPPHPHPPRLRHSVFEKSIRSKNLQYI